MRRSRRCFLYSSGERTRRSRRRGGGEDFIPRHFVPVHSQSRGMTNRFGLTLGSANQTHDRSSLLLFSNRHKQAQAEVGGVA